MRILSHNRGNPDPDYVEAYPTAPPLDSTLFLPRPRTSLIVRRFSPHLFGCQVPLV